ncbi:MAG TPA: hypothetical protein VFA68_09710 [Terriglobales bacterium]|nr:hypothetical protein [Terriglobales bacterium]
MKISAHVSTLVVAVVVSIGVFGQRSTDESGTKSSTQRDATGTVNPARVSESWSKKGNRTTDKKSLETIGPDGKFVPYSDTETQTVQVNASTVRTIRRSYARDVNGNRSLVQVTEEETKTSPNGSQDISRTTSNPDLNGRLNVVQKEMQQIKRLSPSVQESTTTVLMPDLNGTLNPSMRVQYRETQTGEHASQFRKSTLLPDGNGSWQTVEVREGTKKDSPQGGSEERVLQPGPDGKLAIVQKTVSRLNSNANENKTTSETYSNDVPGMAADNSLHLVEKVTTTRRNNASGEQKTEQTIQRPSAGNPSDGLRTTQKVIDISRPNGSASQQQKVTTQSLDANGSLNVIWVDTSKQDTTKPVQVDTKQAAKAAAKPKK